MILLPQFLRVIAIQRVLIRHGFDEIILSQPMFSSIAFCALSAALELASPTLSAAR